MRFLKRTNKGFTIVELAVVIAVLGILVAIVTVVYPGLQKRVADTQVQGDLRQAAMKLDAYKANVGGFPEDENVVDGGKGLPKSDSSLVYDYTATAGFYCLSAVSERSGKTFNISSTSSEVKEGVCASAVDPIAVVGSQSNHTGSTNSPNLTISRPSGTQAGHVLLATATMIEGGARSTADFNSISGWTLISSRSVTSPNKIRQSVWYKVASASEPSSYTISAVAGSDCKISGTITSFSSVDTTSPIMDFAYNVNSSNSTTAAYGSVAATGNSYLVAVGGGRGTTAFPASAPSMTSPYSVASSARTTAASWMYSYMGAGEALTNGTSKAPPSMTYGGTMSTNMTHSILLRQRTTP